MWLSWVLPGHCASTFINFPVKINSKEDFNYLQFHDGALHKFKLIKPLQ